MSIVIEHRPITVKEYHRMAQAGILQEDEHIELIQGEIIKMSPIGLKHRACVNRLNTILTDLINKNAIVQVQSSIILPDRSEPEPDIVILKLRADFYEHSEPGPNDILILMEVADSSLEYDREVKLPLYASAGIREFWLINLIDKLIEVHTQPVQNRYGLIRIFGYDEAIQSEVYPEWKIAVNDVIG